MHRIDIVQCRHELHSAALLVLLLGLPGCMIPYPNHEVYEGTEIKAESLSWLRAGETTRSEVEGKLGAPDIDFVDQRVIAYAWSGQSGGVLLVAPHGGDTMPIRMRRALLIRFDDRNRADAFSVIGRPTEIIPYDVRVISFDAEYDDWRTTLNQWLAEHGQRPGQPEAGRK